MISHSSEKQKPLDPAAEKARQIFDLILNGAAPEDVSPDALGDYATCYDEMVRAYNQGGTPAARQVFLHFSSLDTNLATLRASDVFTRRDGWTVRELLETSFPEPKWAVPGLLPVGLVMLAGRPKLGKSWLSLQMAIAVGSGGNFLSVDVPLGKVLYLALEDSARRLKGRLEQQQAPKASDVRLYETWPTLLSGGMTELFEAVEAHRYSLVVIDTLTRALGPVDQMDQAEMTAVLGALQRFALNHEICMLVVDHHRKAGSLGDGDVIDDLLGATSKAGVADAAIGLYRHRGERTAVLKITGRDIDDRELAITFDEHLFCWRYDGEADTVKSNTLQAEIVGAIEQLGGTATTTQIARFLHKRASNISPELNELVLKGRVLRGERNGRAIPYSLIDTDDSALEGDED